jgi:hypothetical protein
MKKLFFVFVFTLFACFAQAQEVKKVGDPQTGRLQMFGFKYTSWTITFTDGTKGTLCQDEQNNRYFVDTATSRAYYEDRESCIKAVYYWEKENRLIKEGKR